MKPQSETDDSKNLFSVMYESLKDFSLNARDKIEKIDMRMAKLRTQRLEFENALPHADDLADWICRNIDRHRAYYDARAASYLHPHTLSQRGWSGLDDAEVWANGFAAFRLDGSLSDTPKGYLSPPDRDVSRGDPIDPRALLALLSEPLKAGARDLVLRLAPQTEKGMRRADRDQALNAIDKEIGDLNKQRHDILDELKKAAGIVS